MSSIAERRSTAAEEPEAADLEAFDATCGSGWVP